MKTKLSPKDKSDMWMWRKEGHTPKEIAHIYGLRLRDVKRILRAQQIYYS